MKIEFIPLEQTPAQSFGILLNEQECRISVYMRGKDLYFDLYKDNEPIYLGSICYDRTDLTPYQYRGFDGHIFFVDAEGKSNPDYKLFDERFFLAYVYEETNQDWDNTSIR